MCHPWEGLLRSQCCDANREPACMQQWAGSASMENRALPLHAAQKNPLPSMVPPRPFTRSHPYRTPPAPAPAPPHPPGPSVLAAPLPAYQKYAWRNNGRSIHTKPGMCLNVAGLGPSPLSERALCPLFPPRKRHRDSESMGGSVNTEGGERKGMW